MAETVHGIDDLVILTLPASSAYLSVLRTATAGLAARLDFTLDEIEDLRIAVGEACGMLLNDAPATGGGLTGGELTCRFHIEEDVLRISVSVSGRAGRLPARDTFAWTVLSALAGEVDTITGPAGETTIRLVKRRLATSAPGRS